MSNPESVKPYNLEAETACICAMIKNKNDYNTGLAKLKTEDFYDQKNQKAFEILIALYDKSSEVNEITIHQEAQLKGYDKFVDKDYLRDIQEFTYAVANFDALVKIVIEHSVCRKLFKGFGNLTNNYVGNKYDSINEFLSIAKHEIDTVLNQREVAGFLKPTDVADDLGKKIEDARKIYRDEGLTGLDTGYRPINNLTQGFQPGNLIILAARPGIGKTSLALNIAENISKSPKGGPVAFFSQEMQASELAMRIVSFESGISSRDLSRGQYSEKEKAKLHHGLELFKNGRIYIDETPGIEWLDLVAKAKQIKQEQPDLKLIIVDHIGLIKNKAMESKGNVSRTNYVGYISKNLKILAKELNIPILVLCQLSRAVDSNPGKRPILSNLRESGDIEQDADVVLGMSVLTGKSLYDTNAQGKSNKAYAGNVKTPDATDEQKLSVEQQAQGKVVQDTISDFQKKDPSAGLVLIETLKNRSGPLSKIILEWIGKVTSFYELDKQTEINMINIIKDAL